MKTIIIFLFAFVLQGTKNMPQNFAHYEMALCSADFFAGLVYTEVGSEIERVIERIGYRKVQYVLYEGVSNRGKFLPEHKRKHDFETFFIYLRIPVDKTNKEWPPEMMEIYNIMKNVKRQNVKIGALDVVQTSYYLQGLDPAGELSTTYFCDYGFKMDNVFVQIAISSKKNNLAQFDSDMQKVIQSFKLKKNSF